MKLNKILAVVFLLTTLTTYAQLKVDAEIRPRFEYRHGFKTLFPDNTDPAAFVSQRTRLNAGYTLEKIDFYLSFQDVRVWGDVPQLNKADRNGFSLHEAWARIALDTSWALKFGRQEVIYDDSRIFGNVGWAQQARSHDVAIVQYNKKGFRADIGLAFNQDGEAITGTTLTTNTYKAFQYAWLHKDWKNVSGSLLILNNGLQYIDETNSDNNDTRYSQTIGTHLKTKGKVSLTANLFYQFGKDIADNDLSTYLLALEAKYKASDKVSLGLGGELISGNDNGTPTNGDNNAFNPFYGTNHKFNGLMDYFYVGNHLNNVGLLDVYASANFKLNSKSNLNVAIHNFSAAADYTEKQFGNEVDLVYSYKVQKFVTLKAGYSHLFESEGMEILKGNLDGNTNNWGWLMIVVKPTLFTSGNN